MFPGCSLSSIDASCRPPTYTDTRGSMERLQCAQGVQQLNDVMLNSVAPSTSRFLPVKEFNRVPLHQQNIVLFAAHLLLSHSGIQGHLAAISSCLLFMGLSTPILFHHSTNYI